MMRINLVHKRMTAIEGRLSQTKPESEFTDMFGAVVFAAELILRDPMVKLIREVRGGLAEDCWYFRINDGSIAQMAASASVQRLIAELDIFLCKS